MVVELYWMPGGSKTRPFRQEKAETQRSAHQRRHCSGPLAQQQAGHQHDDEVHRDAGRTDTSGRDRQCGHQRNETTCEQDARPTVFDQID